MNEWKCIDTLQSSVAPDELTPRTTERQTPEMLSDHEDKNHKDI